MPNVLLVYLWHFRLNALFEVILRRGLHGQIQVVDCLQLHDLACELNVASLEGRYQLWLVGCVEVLVLLFWAMDHKLIVLSGCGHCFNQCNWYFPIHF